MACWGRGFRDGDALEADREPGLVHHGEHGRHAAVFLADQIADAAAMIAVDHVAGRRGMHPELVLDACGAQIVAGGRACRRVPTRNFGIRNSDRPLVPSGAPGRYGRARNG